MAITLARICANAEKTYGMKLIAGRAGMDNFVRWVHIVEDSEVPDFMHGNELCSLLVSVTRAAAGCWISCGSSRARTRRA